MLKTDYRTVYHEEHAIFREQVRKFFDRELLPNLARWEQVGIVDRDFWLACGRAGLLCPTVSEEYGGSATDFRYNAVINEELCYAGSAAGIILQNDVAADYFMKFASEELKNTWLPPMVTGEVISAVAMTEPGAGSDLQGIVTTAKRDGDHYVINGSKTYITNGQHADIVIVVVKTDTSLGAKGISLVLVEAFREGFSRGRNLDKIGQHSADTSELFFHDLRVPVSNCIGRENNGFSYLMKSLTQERLSIAIASQAAAQRAFDEGVNYTKHRKAFGQLVFDMQNTRFTLADLATKLQVGWAHLDWALQRHVEGQLTAVQASAAKLYHSELFCECSDAALQLHGGAGYMNDYPIAQFWRDARVTKIFGGTSEIMKELIGRSL